MPREKKIPSDAKKTTAMIPKDLYDELFPSGGIRVAETINEGLALVAAARRSGKNHTPITAQQPHFLKDNIELHIKLERILNSKDEVTIAAVVPNIEVFYDRLKPGSKSVRRAEKAHNKKPA